MARDLTQWQILTELEPVAGQALDRHLSMARDWHPHDYIPWDDGRNFAMLGGTDWEPGQSRLPEVAKAALVTNLLTEDNLPSYHREISANFSPTARGERGSAAGPPRKPATPSSCATTWWSPAASTPSPWRTPAWPT